MKLGKNEKLVYSENRCCGCGLCEKICQVNAIEMREDELGFKYPVINTDRCVGCGSCYKLCSFNNVQFNDTHLEGYAAYNINKEQLMGAASGGIFSAFSTAIIGLGGVVYGCSLYPDINKYDILTVSHVRVENLNELRDIQGSKYVQSDIRLLYNMINDDIKEGKYILVSGTPCQIAAIKKCVKEKKYDKIFYVDIICHGVPSLKMFQDYLLYIEKKYRIKVTEFKFRDKKIDKWGYVGSFAIRNHFFNKRIRIVPELCSYYSLFLDSSINRESCYGCPFACKYRVGDITIGDFWEIEKIEPEIMKEEDSLDGGISCVLVNSFSGKELLNLSSSNLKMHKSSFENISQTNRQLLNPSIKSKHRDEVLEIYKKEGFQGLERWNKKILGKRYIIIAIWNACPGFIRKIVRRFIFLKNKGAID